MAHCGAQVREIHLDAIGKEEVGPLSTLCAPSAFPSSLLFQPGQAGALESPWSCPASCYWVQSELWRSTEPCVCPDAGAPWSPKQLAPGPNARAPWRSFPKCDLPLFWQER